MKKITYIIVFLFITSCSNKKEETANAGQRIVKVYLQSDNNMKKIYSIEKYDSLNNLIEQVDYSYENGLIDCIKRIFYDSLNRQILVKTGYPYSTESKFRMVYSYYNDSGLVFKQVRTENYSKDSSIFYFEYYPTKKIKLRNLNDSIFTHYDYSNQGKLKKVWTSVKNSKENDKILPEQIFYGDSLIKTYYRYGGRLFLADSTICTNNYKVIFKNKAPDGFDKEEIYFKDKLIIEEIQTHRKTYYSYDNRKRLIKKEVIKYHSGSIFDSSSSPTKDIYTYEYE